MRSLKKKLDVSEYGGAVLLGVNRPVVKAHGNAKAPSIVSAIRVAAEFAASGAVAAIAQSVAEPAKEADVPCE